MKNEEKESKVKDKRVYVRVSQEDLALIKNKAELSNMTISKYMLDSALKKNIIVIDGLNDFMIEYSYLLQEQAKYIYEINKIGVNINQIANQCNLNENVSEDDIIKLATFYGEVLRINKAIEFFLKSYTDIIERIETHVNSKINSQSSDD